MDKNTIIVFTADHGELGGNHQMRGKGNCAYRQQNHVPLMIVHPAYPGGIQCRAVTSQIDLLPTLLGAHRRAGRAAAARSSAGLKGRDFSPLADGARAGGGRYAAPGRLFNYNMFGVPGLCLEREDAPRHDARKACRRRRRSRSC